MFLRIAFSVGAIVVCFTFGGCNTLASLGLPTGTSPNKLLKPAKEIANSPENSLLLPKELATAPLPSYVVAIEDSILIEPVNFDATIRLPGDQLVKPDGTISLGQFGQLHVAGNSIEQIQTDAQQQINARLEQDLNAAYVKERDARDQGDADAKRDADARREDNAQRPALEEDASGQDQSNQQNDARDREAQTLLQRRIAEAIRQNEISARLINWDSKKIYVLGEVNSPSSFIFTGNQTVLDSIIEAGGLTSKANHHEIVVARPSPTHSCRVVMKVCYDQIVQLGDTSTNYQLQPGDRVFVPALTFADDLRQTLRGNRYNHCPRCAAAPTACQLELDGCSVSTDDHR